MTTLPEQFARLMAEQWGTLVADKLMEALTQGPPTVSVRLNPQKSPLPTLPFEPVPWCPQGYYLPSRPTFTFDPLLHAGAYYVQDASSMFLWHLLEGRFDAPVVALDLCAAPGGKTTLLHSRLPRGSVVVSNEPIRSRAHILAENVSKWGSPCSIVTQNYPQDFAPFAGVFDLVVADVPCSGEGMFRKDEQAVAEWSLQNVEMCRQRQRDIVRSVWPALKPGGLMVYSTCTFNRMENEDNVSWICSELGAERVDVPAHPAWGIVGQYHFLPGSARGEGQYMALLRKDDSAQAPCRFKAERGKNRTTEPRQYREYVAGDYLFHTTEAGCRAIPAVMDTLFQTLSSRLCVLQAGILLAVPKGKGWQPAHQLALSTSLRPQAFPRVELDEARALSYLSHEALQLSAPRGYVLLTHRNIPLGFANNLGPRANNLYPAEWRIRNQRTQPFSLFTDNHS